MTAADPERDRAEKLHAFFHRYAVGMSAIHEPCFDEIAAALRSAREEERERCAGIADSNGSPSCRCAQEIRSGAPAARDEVREAEAAVVEAAIAYRAKQALVTDAWVAHNFPIAPDLLDAQREAGTVLDRALAGLSAARGAL